MKIVYVITGLSMGGAEKQVCLLADKMAERGNEVTLISLGKDARTLPENNGVIVYQMSLSKNPFSFIKTYFKVRKIVKTADPDVLHSHLFHANLLCRLLRCTTRLKCLISSSHSRYEGGWLRMFLYKITSPLCDLITNVSVDAVKENIRKKIAKPEQIISVSNGIDTSKFKFMPTARKSIIDELSLSDEHTLLLAVGRFTEAKDYPNLLEAFRILIHEKNQNHLRLLIAGEGALFPQISALRKKLNLESHLFFLGVRHDIPELMSAADIYIMSSSWEGLPLVIGEAMACNSLIITTNCGGVSEILGDCGTIVPVHSSNLLAEGVIKILGLNDDERNDLKSRARARIEGKFSINAVVDNWLQIYKNKYEK
ncbi:glycosyltransferase [Enterobacter sichuanensis]|uniref:glycosyltransferase n=1 Tax=Enterobacter sichuanensis TaxID=2071710 RepID=UPI0012AAB162|nr:glycosyltransferase [Enterobacter sichuanensis]QFQ09908.1 glycosyl transferase [Enterobacter sichuanensis]